MPMNRVRVPITGFQGGPGLTTLYVGTSVIDMTAIKAFFNSLSNNMPGGVTFTVPIAGDIMNEANGAITGTWTGSNGGTAVSVAAAAAYSAPSGAVIDWLTSTIVGRRRIQGRTFVVPLTQVSYDNVGTLSTTTVTTITTAATTLITALAGELKIWHRPHKGGVDGVLGQVIAARVPDKAVILTGRRD